MRIYIKNMVCERCITAVRSVFEKAGIDPLAISLGEVQLSSTPDKNTIKFITDQLHHIGFEIINNTSSRLIEKIKLVILNDIHHAETPSKTKFSKLIEDEVGRDYTYLSNLFSSVEGQTIEHYIQLQKTEKIKELLVYNEYTITEIAERMGYSSAAYLSTQFKKITGLTPGHFKKLGAGKRKSLDQI